MTSLPTKPPICRCGLTCLPKGVRGTPPYGAQTHSYRTLYRTPRRYEAQVRPRSGLALKHGITVLNSPGTIDADYRGEISVLLINLSQENFEIANGERIAQMVFAPYTAATFVPVEELSQTERGTGGYGSTGKQ